MEEKTSKPLPTLLIIFLIGLAFVSSFCRADIDGVAGNENISEESNLKTYIVFVRKPEGEVLETHQSLAGWYRSFLPDTISSGNHQRRMVYTYKNVVSGFAVKLTAEEARAMEEKDGFVSAKPERVLPLHTTHSPNFLGLYENFGLWRGSNYGEGVIIGVLDTGVTPDHPSFSDEGLPSPPKKWKGKCEFSGTMCKKKLIGARNFVTPEKPAKPEPPFDEEGHGTHTASTAAGNFVKNADVFGNANGTAVGMAPLAHLAIYKVCDDFGCSESDILAAMDTAVEDGVDVLSLSLGGFSAPFYDDAIAVGAFGAIQQGIFVSCSAGNSGPENFTLSNEAPWILTVGASTIDRSIRATVMLGNGQQFFGESLYQPEVTTASLLPLVYAGQNGSQSAALCGPGSLDKIDVKGRIVLCERGGGIARIQKGQVVKDAGGAGMILMNEQPDGYSTLADAHVLPASHVSYAAGTIIKAYINSTSSPIAQFLFQGTIIGVKTAPMVASFSSRGPSYASPGILSGIAALLKSAHPSWSPAAIKSAIMTTAGLLNVGGGPILDERYLPADILATGAGHVNPAKASDPGLVYDIHPDDYIPYLCGLSYTDREITYIVQRKVKCSEFTAIPEAQLNYPSFSIVFGNETQTYTRTVTNVGPNNLIYSVLISPPPGVNVTVSPSQLVFTNSKQTATYTVTFTKLSQGYSGKPFSQGSLTWFSQHYSVRSPIQALFSLPE